MTVITDYGVGNLFSLKSSLNAIGAESIVSGNADEIRAANRIILPGVGAFGDAADKLRSSGLDAVLKEQAALGKPILGICLGMQLLFDKSFEYGEHEGLGLIHGEIRPIADFLPKGSVCCNCSGESGASAASDYKIPHIGWNVLNFKNGGSEIFKHIKDGDHVYFVHSYHATNCAASMTASTEYGAELCAAAQNGNVFGCQFHPEKSGTVGLNILRGFCELGG